MTPAAEAIRPDAERQTEQCSGQDRRGGEKPELGRIQMEQGADRDACDSEHRPHRETDGECPGGHEQNPKISGLRHPYL